MQIIGGQFKKRKIFTPHGEQTRPSKNILRETLFNISALHIEGAIYADLFAGSGAVGFEALSRGAEHVYFIENHKNAIAAIKKNIELLKVEDQTTLIQGDVLTHFKKIPHFCDLVFADPPYQKAPLTSYSQRLLELLDRHPLLKEGGRIYIETRKNEVLPLSLYTTLELVKDRKIGDSRLTELRQKASIESL